jgi:hypothetical protein
LKKVIPLLIALVAILFLWIFMSEEEPITGEFYKAPLPEKFIKSSYYSDYDLENKFVIYVDFSKRRQKRRLWVVDKGEVIATSYTAHGEKSASFNSYLPPRRFSNRINSDQSSLGIYLITTQFRMGTPEIHHCSCDNYVKKSTCSHWPKAFKLIGKSGSNSNAKVRGILIHTGSYVSENGCTDNSDGCFTVSPEVFEILQKLPLLRLLRKKCYLVAIK